jgi:hypothetical protein
MGKIYELHGYRLNRWNQEAERTLRRAWCPFMDAECDGGGNRYQSAISVRKNAELRVKFPDKEVIQCGVCSLQTHPGEQPWIVCPRRLLSLKHGHLSAYQSCVRERLSAYAELDKGKPYTAWSEVKIKTEAAADDAAKSFNYTFDYILAGAERRRVREIAEMLALPVHAVQKIAKKSGYTLASHHSEMWIENFPADPLMILEVMTSSTSGGDKKKRTQIAMACEDAMLYGEKHNAPGINYRQVWARMVSQLIVKSQVGMAWGGKTIWLVQDVLADYISKSTALLLPQYAAERLDEVNIMSCGYGTALQDDPPLMELRDLKLYSGPITQGGSPNSHGGFVDIVKIGAPPPKSQLWKSLLNKPPIGVWKW